MSITAVVLLAVLAALIALAVVDRVRRGRAPPDGHGPVAHGPEGGPPAR